MERFWLMMLDEPDDGRWAGSWAVVDEEAGGIVAVAPTQEQADALLRHLASTV